MHYGLGSHCSRGLQEETTWEISRRGPGEQGVLGVRIVSPFAFMNLIVVFFLLRSYWAGRERVVACGQPVLFRTPVL
jgi:hypothetical protein